MKRKSKLRYEVSQGEMVTIKVTPVETGARVTATDTGETLENSNGPDTPTFEFEVTQASRNRHFVIVECSFLDEDPNTAHFDFELRGSKGGVFKDVVIRKTNQIWDPEFQFIVS